MADSAIESVALLCHFENTNTATYIFDTSKNLWSSATASCVGTTALSATQKKFGTTSLKTGSANGNYWRYPASRVLDFGGADFTIETHVWPVSQGADYGAILGRWDDSTSNKDLLLWRAADGSVNVSVNGTQVVTGAAGLPTGAFAHVALTRQGNTLTVWIEGVAKGSGSLTGAINCTMNQPFVLGQSNFSAGSTWLEAYYDELRITLGVCRYTAGFTPPTAQYDDYLTVVVLMRFDQRLGTLTWQDSSRFSRVFLGTPNTPPALSASPAKFGNSVFFSGAAAYIYNPNTNTPELNVGASDFCIEGWFYPTSFASTGMLVSMFNGGAASPYKIFRTGSQIQASMSTNGSSYTHTIGPVGALSVNTWYHVALVRSGTTITLYLNGAVVGTVAITAGQALVAVTNSLYFGGEASNFYWTGYMDDWRMVVGSPVYYATFTPPTSAFPDPSPQLAYSTKLMGRALIAWRRTPTSLAPVSSQPTGYRLRSRDMAFGGVGRIAGQVTINQVVASRKVRLLDRLTGLLVQEQWAKDDGSYAFEGIDETRKYTALGHDHQNTYNAVVQDNITPDRPAYPAYVDQKYKRTVRFTAAETGLGTNYPMLLRVGESTLSSSADISVPLKRFPSAKDDNTADIKFTDTSDTALEFWLEQVTGTAPNRTAYYWVRIPGNLDSGPQDVVVTYNGAVPTKTSNGANVFPMLFDDFGGSGLPDTGKWNRYNDSGGFVWINANSSVVTIQGRTGYVEMRSSASFNAGTEILSRQTSFAGYNSSGQLDTFTGFATGAIGSPTMVVVNDIPPARTTQHRLAINNEDATITTGDFPKATAPARIQIRWGADGSAQLLVDGVLNKTRTGVSGSSANVMVARTYGGSESSQVDYIAVRKYIPGGVSITSISAESLA